MTIHVIFFLRINFSLIFSFLMDSQALHRSWQPLFLVFSLSRSFISSRKSPSPLRLWSFSRVVLALSVSILILFFFDQIFRKFSHFKWTVSHTSQILLWLAWFLSLQMQSLHFPFRSTGESMGTFSNEELLKLADNFEITTMASLCRASQC